MHGYPKPVDGWVGAAKREYRPLQMFVERQCGDDVRPSRIPKLESTIHFGKAIKRQSRVNDVIDAKIAADHFQIGHPDADADRRSTPAMRQQAHTIAQQVKSVWLRDDLKWQSQSLSVRERRYYDNIATVNA